MGSGDEPLIGYSVAPWSPYQSPGIGEFSVVTHDPHGQADQNFRREEGTVEAVKGVDINVAPGELVAFLGPNGAGTSTTLRMLTTLLRPTSGTATVAVVDVSADPAGVRARIGYIGQGNGGGHSRSDVRTRDRHRPRPDHRR